MTHVFLSHHHPDHTVNIALFPNAEVVDFWARYKDDLWLDHEGDVSIMLLVWHTGYVVVLGVLGAAVSLEWTPQPAQAGPRKGAIMVARKHGELERGPCVAEGLPPFTPCRRVDRTVRDRADLCAGLDARLDRSGLRHPALRRRSARGVLSRTEIRR